MATARAFLACIIAAPFLVLPGLADVETEAVIARTEAIQGLKRDLAALSRDVDVDVSSFDSMLIGVIAEFERDSASIVDAEQGMRDKVDRAELMLRQLASAAQEAAALRAKTTYTWLWLASGCLWSLVAALAILQFVIGGVIDAAGRRAARGSPMRASHAPGSVNRRWGARASAV